MVNNFNNVYEGIMKLFNKLFSILDDALRLNQFYDVKDNLISEGDIVSINYKQYGHVERVGMDLVIVFQDVEFQLYQALKCFRVEIVGRV